METPWDASCRPKPGLYPAISGRRGAEARAERRISKETSVNAPRSVALPDAAFQGQTVD